MGTNGQPEKTKSSLDWDGIRRQADIIGERLAMAENETSEELAEIWQRRAVQLAQLPEDDEKGEQVELLLVRIGREVFGLEVAYVHDIRPIEGMTRVPRTPAWIGGVVNVHGQILTALRLEHFFGLSSVSERETGIGQQFLVLVQTGQAEMVLIVQEVIAVQAFPLTQVQSSSGTIRGIRPEFVKGVIAKEVNEDLLVFLDLPTILADQKLFVHEEVL
jgi:purine-binding chemotaxis protein CheW